MRTIQRFALLLPVLAACGTGPLDPGPFTLEGSWLGRDYPYELSFELEQDGDNRVTGTGRLTGLAEILETVVNPDDPTDVDTTSIDTIATGTVTFDVDGDWNHPDFDLELTSAGYAGALYDARFANRDTVRGNLRGSGFSNPEIEIIRQSTQP
ncbi:hypothetical protein [Longimicrobium sp.]|uniref:hypothetical protein n=1 Tax=Longimicrobium sp. TaxID=2029185 RepID=UPI003B3B73C6